MRQNNKRAFTLVEVLIVIVIIGILFIVLMANVDFSTDEAKETGTKAIMQSYKLAAETIALENSGFTNDKAELVKVLNKRLDLELQLYVEGGEIKSKQTDSWGKEFKFMQSTPVNTYGMFAIQSAGPDGLFDNGDDIIMENKYVVVNGVGQVVTEFPEIDPNHSHSYVLRVTEPLFLKSPATCQSAAVYYYSCECGKMNGTEFNFGVADPEAHGTLVKQPVKKVPIDYAVHRTDSTCPLCLTVLSSTENPHRPDATGEHCLDCGEQLHIHIYDKEIEANQYKKNDANCTEPLTYFKSCECGAASPDEIFTKGTALGHDFTKKSLTYKISDSNCRDYAKYFLTCQRCDAKSDTPYDHIDGGKSETNHVGGTYVEYTWVDDLRHIKDTICNGCGAKRSSITEPHVEDGECCHTHSYTKTVEATAYEHTALTCTSKAVYYKSCECGKSSQGATNETFEGSATPTHLPATTPTWNSDHSVATISCTRGVCSEKWTSSVVNQITTTTATCVTERQYKHRANINVDGTSKTFDCIGHTGTTNASNHLRDPEYPKVESICKWYPCCETVIDDTHNWNVSAANCQTAKQCVDCGFVAEEKTDHIGPLEFARIAGVCQRYSGCGCTYLDHDLGSAACTTAASCKRSGCSYSSGEAEGHLVNTNSAIWNSDHSSVKFICSRSGCSSSWDLSTTEKVTTTANCVTAKQYKHTLTVSISGKVTISGNTSLECSGHTGSVNPSKHASDCVWEPVSSPTSTLCQKRSKCEEEDNSHSWDPTTITCGSNVERQTCEDCGMPGNSRPEHTPTNGKTENVHRKCSVCNKTLEGKAYHVFSKTSAGTSCEDTATYTCSCGYSYVDDTGSHEWIVDIWPTCTTSGKDHCKNCPEIRYPNEYGHSYATSGAPSWDSCRPYYPCLNGCGEKQYHTTTKVTITTATCATAGEYEHKVTLGGQSYYCNGHTSEKDPSNHEEDYTAFVGPAGTGVANICEYYPCCGVTYSSSHDYNRSSASCTENKYCEICDYVAQYATGHSGTEILPSGGGSLYVHSVYSGCGHTYSSEHDYGDATCMTPATCICGHSTGGTGGHDLYEETISTQTCTEGRVYKQICRNCENEFGPYNDTVKPALGHDWAYECSTICRRDNSHRRQAEHSFSDQDCTTGASCDYGCGTTVEKLDHEFSYSWTHENLKITCDNCSEVWDVVGKQDNKTYGSEPTCENPEQYDHWYSGEIDGQSVYSECGTIHTGQTIDCSYKERTCTEPAKCKWCGSTKPGSTAAGHDKYWSYDDLATCTEKCNNCTWTGYTEDHDWYVTEDYSSYHTKKCSNCKEEKDFNHVYGFDDVVSYHAYGPLTGHNNTHDVTYECQDCDRHISFSYQSCTFVNKKCLVCDQSSI